MSTDLSVVIPAHNAAGTLAEQLEALRAQDTERLAEVVVVDSMSTDATRSLLHGWAQTWSKISAVVCHRPGANAARNEGIRHTHTERILMCDADDVVGEGWLAALAEALDHFDLVRGSVEAEKLNDPATVAARGPLGSGFRAGEGDVIAGLGGNCAFRRSVWTSLGGLNEASRGIDDAEFFWRAQLAGFTVGHVPEAIVHYRLRSDMRSLYRQQRGWAEGRAQLYKDFRTAGLVSRRTMGDAAKSWAWVATHVSDGLSSDPQHKGRWLRTLARNVGRLRGSLHYRVFFP